MSDPVKIVRELLLANSGVTVMVAQNVFGGVLPEQFDPTNNPGITISVKGGSTHSEIPLQYPSIQVACWAGVNQFVLVRQVYGAVFACLHGLNDIDFGDDGRLISCVEESVGQDITDPDAGWVTVVNSFSLKLTGGVSITDPIAQNQAIKAYVDAAIAAALSSVASLPIAESEVTGLVSDLASKALGSALTSEIARALAAEAALAAEFDVINIIITAGGS